MGFIIYINYIRYRLTIDAYQGKHMALRSNMTLNDMTADPLNMIFLYHYQNHLCSIFYNQGGPGTTIGYIIIVKYILVMTIKSYSINTCYIL